MSAPRQMHLVIGHVVQFIVHVARSVDVNARRDERHDHEHQHRQSVDVPADRKPERPALVERIPVARIRRGHMGGMVAYLASMPGMAVMTAICTMRVSGMRIGMIGRMPFGMAGMRHGHPLPPQQLAFMFLRASPDVLPKLVRV